MKLKLSFLALLLSVITFAQSAPAYYNSIDFTKTGNDLKMQLATLISRQTAFTSYNGLLSSYKDSDADPANKSNILLIYGYSASGKTQRSRPYANNDFNREHVFPKSLGSPNLGTSGPGSDLHHIRPADIQFNGDRGNTPFADGTDNAGKQNGGWYPGDEWKGDVARIIMFMYVRYGDRTKPSVVGLGPATYSSDMPDIFLKWNVEDPVSAFEKQRQEVAYTAQGNRNPFIDNPYLATVIWKGPEATNTWPTTFQGATPPPADYEKPTVPTNLASANITANTFDLSWTPSSDNIGVVAYEIYVNGVLQTTVNGSVTSATITGLTANTAYSVYIIAKDEAGNASDASNTLSVTTNNIVVTPPPSTDACFTENFDGIPDGSNPSSYSNRTWTTNGITWNATLARTDETINSRAITINTGGKLTSSTYANGLGSLTVTTQLKFTGSPGTLDVLVNGTKVGTVAFSDEVETTTIPNINVNGNAVVTIANNSSISKTRVAIDDLSWTCYSSLATVDPSAKTKFMVYPNPVRNSEIYINGLTEKTDVQLYSISGQLVQTFKAVSDKQRLELKKLPKGVYLVKAGNQTAKIIID